MAQLVQFIICIFLLSTIESVVEGSEDKSKRHENDALHDDGSVQLGKPRRLFARTRFELQQRLQRPRPRTVTATVESRAAPPPRAPPALPARVTSPVAPVVVRRCPGLMEACSPHLPCCDPCATCHCRLFNTICHCWRMSHLCPKKT
ncbi:hypothetical protein AALO_G00017340 [Alosa alosa]|uniref:Agouti domain-containing protein n=1 Tax=Alosa alosa TaxID=278164 RepID=A0AAV6HL55_9TELE|nr:agouti-signaling protein 2b [Alosa alosa]KAG5286656.1 hypothetical protein AALO_G00017340 [Alosa alosa]